jgi:hypothetical protein
VSGTFTLPPQASANVNNPPAGYYRFFVGDGTDNTAGTYYKKDATGTVTPLVPASYTDAQARTAVSTMFATNNSITWSYNATGQVETALFKIPLLGALTATAKTYVLGDSGGVYTRTNGGTTMTDTLPALAVGDNGWHVDIQNLDTVAPIILTTASPQNNATFPGGAVNYTLQPNCRQQFLWSGSAWLFHTGNANLTKAPTAGTAGLGAGALAAFTDTIGRQLAVATGAQVAAASAVATTTTQGAMSAADKTSATNWYDRAVFNVLDHGINPNNTGAVNSAAWTTLMTAVADNGVVLFPTGAFAYPFASTCAIPAGKHLKVCSLGGGEKAIIQTTSATADIFSCGDWYQEFEGLKFTSSVTRTAGAAINSGNNVSISIYNCDFAGMWDAVLYTGGANAGNLAVISNLSITGNLNRAVTLDGQNANTIIEKVVVDGTAGVNQVGLELLQCGSVLVSNCDFIRSVNNLRFNPATSLGVFSAYFTNTFFDTSSASSVKFTNTGNVQRVKFINCWFSGSVTGCEFASTAANTPTAIDFVACDIFGNTSIGVLANGVQDFAMSNCRIAGNATAGIRVFPSAGAVTKFNLQNNTIGPTAGFGANGIGLDITAGTYGGYNISGNDVRNNTNNLNINDAGTVATTDLKVVADNLGHLMSGLIASLGAPLALSTTTETLVLAARVPANAVMVGSVLRWRASAIVATTTATVTWRARIGTLGTVAGDTVVADVVVTAAVGTANARSHYEGYLTIRSLGTGGTLEGEGYAITAATVANTTAAAAATSAVNTTTPWFLDLTATLSATAGTVVQAMVEAL